MGTSSLGACSSRPRERMHDVSVHAPCLLLVVFCRRGRGSPAIAGPRALLVHVTRLRTPLASLVVKVTTGQTMHQEGVSRVVERRQHVAFAQEVQRPDLLLGADCDVETLIQ